MNIPVNAYNEGDYFALDWHFYKVKDGAAHECVLMSVVLFFLIPLSTIIQGGSEYKIIRERKGDHSR